MRKGSFFLAVMIVMVMFCPIASAKDRENKVHVFVSILPQACFMDRIGGRRVDVGVLVGEGQSPETYEPTPKQMAKLSTARAYFRIGIPLEKNVIKKIEKSGNTLLIVDTQKGIVHRYIAEHGHGRDEKAARNPREVHRYETPDPHIWMDPKLVKIQAQNIHDGLCILDPLHAAEYGKNLQAFIKDLDRIDMRIAQVLKPLKGKRMYVFHPAFGYFAESYGLTQVAIEMEGKEPSPRQLADTISRAKKEGVKVIFVQPQFSRKSVDAVAKSIGGAVIPIDPLARDYFTNLERIASAVERGLR